jgi:hypothetical protein
MLDAGGDDGHAHISIFSSNGRSNMQVGTQPNGGVVVSFGNEQTDGMLTLSTNGVALREQSGLLAIVIGPLIDGQYNITLYRGGNPVWTAPADPSRVEPGQPGRQPAAKGRKNRGGSAGTDDE